MNNKDQSIGSILVNQDYMCYIIFSSWKEYKMQVKPSKKTDTELFKLIESCIKRKNYIFLKHSKYRMLERRISDLDIINILLGIKTNLRVRNKKKDSYDYYINEEQSFEWRYCVEGVDIDGKKIRIIITFRDKFMLIITVIKL